MPKLMYCWRCQMEIPMLTNEEFDEFKAVFTRPFPEDKREQLALDFYHQLTGFYETNINAITHHIASQYGPPCRKCNKPLRTPRAQICAACGWGLEVET